jgi:hypothetical protein
MDTMDIPHITVMAITVMAAIIDHGGDIIMVIRDTTAITIATDIRAIIMAIPITIMVAPDFISA